jgi:hypothetical protein
MLAVGAVHLRFCDNPNDQGGACRISQTAKRKVLDLVRQTLELRDGSPRPVDSGEIELVLAALLSCTIASVS